MLWGKIEFEGDKPKDELSFVVCLWALNLPVRRALFGARLSNTLLAGFLWAGNSQTTSYILMGGEPAPATR